jgi:hypothetical protein
VIQSRRQEWAGDAARMRKNTNLSECFIGKPESKRHFENLGVEKRIILKWFLEKWDGVVWSRFIWHRIGSCGGLL